LSSESFMIMVRYERDPIFAGLPHPRRMWGISYPNSPRTQGRSSKQ
jgi:hypothetical protein